MEYFFYGRHLGPGSRYRSTAPLGGSVQNVPPGTYKQGRGGRRCLGWRWRVCSSSHWAPESFLARMNGRNGRDIKGHSRRFLVVIGLRHHSRYSNSPFRLTPQSKLSNGHLPTGTARYCCTHLRGRFSRIMTSQASILRTSFPETAIPRRSYPTRPHPARFCDGKGRRGRMEN